MPGYVGDYLLGASVEDLFNSHDATGAPFTLAGSPAVTAYEQGNATQFTTGTSVTADYDSVTGLVRVVIDTSSGYQTGKDYWLLLTSGSVDGVSQVGSVLIHFSIQNRYMRGTDSAALGSALPANFTSLGINASGHVSRVTLVDTTTANSDMRGTDSAYTGGNITGNLSGSVGSVSGNVGGNVAGSVGSVTGGINTSGGTITTLDGLDTAQDTQHGTTQTAVGNISTTIGVAGAGLTEAGGTGDHLTAVASQTSVNAIATILAGITSLANWLRAAFRSDTPDATAISEINNGVGDFASAADSQEAIADAVDGIEGGGGGGGGDCPTLDEIVAALADRNIVISSPVNETGTMEIWQGDDYADEDLQIPVEDFSYDDPATYESIKFGLMLTSDYNAGTGEPALEVDATGELNSTTATFTIELTDEQTAALTPSPALDPYNYTYQLRAVFHGGNKRTIASGSATVKRKVVE